MSRPMETLWPLLLIYAMGVSESVIIKDGSVHTSYFFSERRLTVEKTHKFCQTRGGQLIVLDEARKFQNVTALLQDYRSKYDRFYVNAKQKSGKTYLWANGVRVRGAFWGEGQPEVNRSNVQLKLYSGSFMLASSYGSYLRYALCENVTSVSSQVSSSSMESTYDLLSSGVYSTMETSESLEMSSYVNSGDPTSAAELWMSTGGSGTEEMTQTITFLFQTREYPDTDGSMSLPSVFSTKSSAVLDTSNSAVSQQNTPTSGSGESQTYAGIQATRLSDAQGMLTLTPEMRTEMQASVDDDGQTLGQFGSGHQNMLTESLENSLLTSDCFSDCHTKSVGIDYSETFQSDDFSVVLMTNLFNPVSSALLSTEQATLPELLDSSVTFQSSFMSFKQTSSLPVSSMMTASSSSPVSQPMSASGSVSLSLTLSESALAMSVAPSLSPLVTSRAFSSPTPPFVMSPQASPTSETFLATSVPLLSDQTIPQSPASDLSVLPTSASGLFVSRTLSDLFVSPTFHQFDSLASESFVISPTSDSFVPHTSTLELFTPLTRTSDLFISEISSSDPVASEASSSDMFVSQMSDSSQFVSTTLVSSEPVLDSLFSQAVGSELQVSVQSDLSSATSEQNVFFSLALQSQRPFSTPETKTEPLDLPTYSKSLPVFLEESEATEVLLVTPVSFLSTSLSLSQSVSFSSVAVPLSLESSLSLVASSSASTVIFAHVSSTAFIVSVQSESDLASSLLSPENMTPVMLTNNISSLYMSAASVPLSLSSLKMTSLLENLPSSSTLIKHSPVSQNLSFFSSATDSSSFTTILMAATLSQNISSMSSLSSLLSSFSTLQTTFPSQSLSPELAISSLLSSPSSLPLSLSTVQATVPPPSISSPLSSLTSSSTISQTTSRPQNISSPSSVLSVPTSSQSTSTAASGNKPPWNKQPSPRGSKGTGCCTCRVESKVTDTLSSADVQSAVDSQVARTKAELTLDTAGLSRQQRKRSSATDHRRSSETMGVLSIAILTVMFVIVVGSDLVCSLRYLKQNGHYL